MININQQRFDFNAKKYVLTSPTNRAVFGAKLFGENNSRNSLKMRRLLRKEMIFFYIYGLSPVYYN